MLEASWWTWWKENIKITRTHSKFYKKRQKQFWKYWTRVRTENEKVDHFRNLSLGVGQKTREPQMYARILDLRQELMKRHAIPVFWMFFWESASLCQNPRVYADAGVSSFEQEQVVLAKNLMFISSSRERKHVLCDSEETLMAYFALSL